MSNEKWSKTIRGVVSMFLLAGCSAMPLLADGGVEAAEDAGTDAGIDAGVVSCGDDKSTPSMPCGTLAWRTSASPSRRRNHHFTFMAETGQGPYLFALGGVTGGTSTSTADSAPLAGDGSVGSWKKIGNLPIKVGGMTGGVISKLVMIAGGTQPTGSVTDQAYAAFILDDGTLSAWSNAGSTLHPRMHPGGFVRGNQLYVLGGFDDPTVWDDVVRATVNDDGTVSPWENAGKLPGPRSHMSVSYIDGYVFITGGLEKSAFINPPVLNEVKRGKLDAEGKVGEWVDMPSLPVKLATHASFFYGGYLYVVGGIEPDTRTHEKRVWRAALGADHSLGAWEAAADLPVGRGHVHQLPIYKNHVYSVSGAIDFDLNSTSNVEVGTFQ
ncbi:MAG: hypothetical protein K1X64_23395 [Myxococcaceae bacterium]|nr:hypothetical protein [Myxococcaceae bacterium]